jgi:hypothetical protein
MTAFRSALLPAVLLTSCGQPYHLGEYYSENYRGPAEKTSSERVERREIVHWKDNPRDKRRIGFLYKYETQVAGSRSVRESWRIYDRLGNTAVGLITGEGVFYRFDEEGRLGQRVGEYPVVATGLKIFFGIPLRENVDVEEIDPYK